MVLCPAAPLGTPSLFQLAGCHWRSTFGCMSENSRTPLTNQMTFIFPDISRWLEHGRPRLVQWLKEVSKGSSSSHSLPHHPLHGTFGLMATRCYPTPSPTPVFQTGERRWKCFRKYRAYFLQNGEMSSEFLVLPELLFVGMLINFIMDSCVFHLCVII